MPSIFNKTENRCWKKSLKKGYEVLHKGWPDFCLVRGDEIVFVECKNERMKEGRDGLSSDQRRMKTILESKGFRWFLYRGKKDDYIFNTDFSPCKKPQRSQVQQET